MHAIIYFLSVSNYTITLLNLSYFNTKRFKIWVTNCFIWLQRETCYFITLQILSIVLYSILLLVLCLKIITVTMNTFQKNKCAKSLRLGGNKDLWRLALFFVWKEGWELWFQFFFGLNGVRFNELMIKYYGYIFFYKSLTICNKSAC